MSYREELRKNLRGNEPSDPISYRDQVRMDLGVKPDTRIKASTNQGMLAQPENTLQNVAAGKVSAQKFATSAKKAGKAQSKIENKKSVPEKLLDVGNSLLTQLPLVGLPIKTAEKLIGLGKSQIEKGQAAAANDAQNVGEYLRTDYPGGFLNPLNNLGQVANTPAARGLSRLGEQFYTPGASIANIAGLTGAVGRKVAPLLGTSLGGRAATEVVKEGIAGAVIGGATSLPHATSSKDVAKGALIGGAIGGAAGGAAPLIGATFRNSKVGQAFINYLNRSETPGPAPSNQPLLGLPAPRQRGNVNTAQTPDVVTPYGESKVFELPSPNVAPPTTARVGQRVNPYAAKLENLFEAARNTELPPGREREAVEDLWSRMAGPEDPGLDELIDLASASTRRQVGPDALNAAKTYQQSRQAAGVPLPVRSGAERYQGGVVGQAAPIEERVGRAPGVIQTRPEPVSPSIPTAPKINVAPEREIEEILQSAQQPRVRDRVVSFLDEAEQAAKKRIASRKNNLSSNPVDEWADHAIVMAAKLGKGTIKVADFTEELVREFGDQVRPYAGQILRRSKDVLQQQERRASKEGLDADAFNNSGVGDASTFDQKISRNAKKKKEPWSRRWERTRTQLTDDTAPLEGLEKRVRGSVASAEDSLSKSARMFKGVPEKAAQRVQRSLTPIVEAIEKAGYTADDLGRYALAKHAKDVNAAGYKSGYTNAEIDDVLRKYGTPEMEAAQQALVRVNKEMLQELVDSGVVSRELGSVLNDRWKNYIPLFRDMNDDAVEFGTGLSHALANVANPIQALKGSEKPVIDPLENMVKNIFRSTNAAERNKVAQQLEKLANIDKDAKFIRKLEPNEQVGRKNVVNVKVNGENVKYEVEPDVYKSLLNLDQESSNMIINILSKPASLLRAGATLTPEFSLRNPMRDINQAYVVSKSGFNPLIDFPVGVVQAILGKRGKGKLYQEWVDNLGAYGNVMSMDRDVHKKALEKVLSEPVSKKFVNIVNPKSWVALLRAISDTTESATKIGEYRAALRSGATPQEAAYRSRDIMDFARAGTGIRQANKIVAFLNANIQGNSKLIRAIKENPVKVTAKAAASVTIPTVGVFMMQKYLANAEQKETIDNAPEWQKDTFWLVPIPGTGTVARIPKPFGLNLVFANPVERLLEKAFNDDKDAFDGFAKRSLSEGALPVQISGLLPFVEGMANYSFFRQGSIIPMREQGSEYRDQYDPIRTTETAKLLAKGAEKLTGGEGAFKNFSSPRIMDNALQGLTAGTGKYVTDAIDVLLQKTGAVDRPKAPAKSIEQRPFIRSFLVDPNQGGKAMDDFYNQLDKLSKAKQSANLRETDLSEEKQNKLDILNGASKQLSNSGKKKGLNSQIKEIESSRTLTPQQKRKQIDELSVKRMQIIKDALEAIGE